MIPAGSQNYSGMESSNAILSSIKSQVRQAIPDARVVLFGSRAYGTPTTESDWDILILTDQPVNAGLKKDVHMHLFPISVEIGAFINALTVQETEWLTNPIYYSLRRSIKKE